MEVFKMGYKEDFIDFVLQVGALSFDGPFRLKSGRMSPYFFNSGKFDDGESIEELGRAYASAILDVIPLEDFDMVFGPAYKGIPLSVATAIGLTQYGVNKGYVFDRKLPKDHGEAKVPADTQKNWLVGREVREGDRLVLVDDVITTGGTKYSSVELINRLVDGVVSYPGLVISLDRQEVDAEGNNAIRQFEERTGIRVYSVVNIGEVRDYMVREDRSLGGQVESLDAYLRQYGTEEAKANLV